MASVNKAGGGGGGQKAQGKKSQKSHQSQGGGKAQKAAAAGAAGGAAGGAAAAGPEQAQDPIAILMEKIAMLEQALGQMMQGLQQVNEQNQQGLQQVAQAQQEGMKQLAEAQQASAQQVAQASQQGQMESAKAIVSALQGAQGKDGMAPGGRATPAGMGPLSGESGGAGGQKAAAVQQIAQQTGLPPEIVDIAVDLSQAQKIPLEQALQMVVQKVQEQQGGGAGAAGAGAGGAGAAGAIQQIAQQTGLPPEIVQVAAELSQAKKIPLEQALQVVVQEVQKQAGAGGAPGGMMSA